MALEHHLDEVIDRISERPEVVTLDTEGVSRMLGFSLCVDGMEEGVYFPVAHEGKGNATEAQKKKMYKVLQGAGHMVYFNAIHDWNVLDKNGWRLDNPFYDPMLMTNWINEELLNYKLDHLSKRIGLQGKAMPKAMATLIEMDGWDIVPVGMMTEYSGNDAWITHRLFRDEVETKFFAEFEYDLWEVEQRFITKVIIPMKNLGIKVDLDFCIQEYQKGLEIMKEEKKTLNMNPGSPKQLKKLLIDELGLPVLKHTDACTECKYKKRPVHTHEGNPSFSADAMDEYDEMLETMGDSRAKSILRYRGWQKVTSSSYHAYIRLADNNSIIYPNYMLHRTRTSRLACADPNTQQIPKASDKEWNGHSKKAFISREGYKLWTIDFSQLQFRMAVAYAEEKTLMAIFNDPTRDIFQEMANDMSWLRDKVKTLVYLILFGGGGERASVAFGIKKSEGVSLIKNFYNRYPGLKKAANEAERVAKVLGYIKFWTGRRRHFFKGGAPTYRAFNAAIQGGEAEIVKRCMIALNEQLCNDECRIVLQIHDEIAFEIIDGKEDYYLPRAQKIMEETASQFCEAIGRDIKFTTTAKAWGEK